MKKLSEHFSIAVVSASAVAAITLSIALPAHADPPSWAPAHGKRAKQEQHYPEREYRYVYYPMQQVYYSPEQQLWYWMHGGAWQFGVALPAQYNIHASTGIAVTLDAARPYAMHAQVDEQYGRPWREEQRVERHIPNESHRDRPQKNRNHD